VRGRTGWVGFLAVVAVAAFLLWGQGGQTGPTTGSPDGSAGPTAGLGVVHVDDLPREAAETLELIDDGGPFPYDRDGVVFENREGLLPERPRGHYHEYTVPTPGSGDRGARRIVTGGPGEYYWTQDHYESFERIQR